MAGLACYTGRYTDAMLTLILGGARSGKSDLAERLALASGRDVTFIATMEAGDAETGARIAAHRESRPPGWRTIEAPRDLLRAIELGAADGSFVIVDCITLWVSNLLIDQPGGDERSSLEGVAAAADSVSRSVTGLLDHCANSDAYFAFVSNEVGLGVVPAYPLGRVYRDVLGATNRAIAVRADRVYWLTAGLALELKSLGAVPVETFDRADGA
jgi:adenosylcobinamide kinase/adenosylcobinamide-phosphate guanylyltransferase